jgi:U3 small nucleolar RNA-associated protein 20
LTLFAGLDALPILPELQSSLLLYITSLFLAGDMSMWLGHGLKFLQTLWKPPSDPSAFEKSSLSFALKLHLCLADAGWAGWKLIGLPLVFRSTVKPDLQLMDSHRRELISFVAALKRGRKLVPSADVDPVWRRKIEAVVLGCLKSCSRKAESVDEVSCIHSFLSHTHPIFQVLELNDLLELSSFCSAAVTMPVIDIASSIICGYNDYRAGHTAGSCMHTISQREAAEWADKINLGLWAKKCVEKWSCLPEVLEGLFALAQAKLVILLLHVSLTDYCIQVLHRDQYLSARFIRFCHHLSCLIQDVFDWLASGSLAAS